MKKLADDLNGVIAGEEIVGAGGEVILHTTSKEWAVYSIDNYTGELLARALAISIAISDFTLELKEPGHKRG